MSHPSGLSVAASLKAPAASVQPSAAGTIFAMWRRTLWASLRVPLLSISCTQQTLISGIQELEDLSLASC
jgi:hypothetical protein